MRKFMFWNDSHANPLARRKHVRRARRGSGTRNATLAFEQLESRLVLSANPILNVATDQFVDEGTPLTITDLGTFSDVVEDDGSGGAATGLDPSDFVSLGSFNPLTNVIIDTDTLTISGGFSGFGATVMADAGHGVFEIAVFTFSDFELNAGITLTAFGSRPLALLSQSDMTIAGTVDGSAFSDGTPFNNEWIAGPGGGNGGLGSNVNVQFNGDAAAGAPANSVGQWVNGGGTGGGFGGRGGRAEIALVNNSPIGTTGQAYGDLAVAIQGGSGGATAGVGFFGGSGILAGGGGGGGGIELGASGAVTVTSSGQVLVNGGDAQSTTSPTSSIGGGGGGAGGGILIHAESVNQFGTLSANGGAGGASARDGGGGGGGTILIVYSTTGSFDNSGGTQTVVGGGNGPGSGGENGQVGVFTFTAEVPAANPVIETFDYVIDWGDDSMPDTGAATIDTPGVNVGDIVAGSFDGNHTYSDNGVYLVTVTINDNNDGTDTATFFVTVSNVAPTLVLSGASNVDEGSAYTLNLSSFDPGDDTISGWEITWGDGDIETIAGNPTSVTHTYADGANNWVITATATDEDGAHTAGNTAAVEVDNVAPTLALSGASNVDEGSVYALNLSAFDPGDDAISQWEITWGDGDVEIVVGNPPLVTHTYADGANNWVISATATDEDGAYAAGNTVAVTVDNVAPAIAIAGAAAVAEGAAYTLNLSSSDPGADTISQWTIDWGDGIEIVLGNPASVTHTYADGTVNYVITATATDEDGTFAAGNTVAVTVNNVAPTANAGGPYQTFDDTPIVLNGTATDPAGVADPLSFVWDLDGDNVFGETGAGATRGDEVGANPTYDPTGLPTSTQTVKLRVSDGDGGVTIVSTTIDILGEGTVLIGGVLYVVGSNSCSDIVIITKVCGDIKVIASFNSSNPMSFDSSLVTEIRVRTRGGHDIVVTMPNVTQLMTIDGGNGNDLLTGGGGRNVIQGGAGHDVLFGSAGDDVLMGGTGNDDLFGGSGNDVLVGGDGCDMLNGGTGRDLLIGSQDEDILNGGGDEDILIGGYTIHDNNVSALDAIMAIWGSAASFNSRVTALTGSGGLLQAGVAVFDDDDNDILVGGAGRDLVFGDTNPWDGAIDLIALQMVQDVLVAVN